MASSIIVGLDIGTSTIRTVVCRVPNNSHVPEVIGSSDTAAFGLRHGYITNHQEAVKSIRRSVKAAEKIAGIDGRVTARERAVIDQVKRYCAAG